MDLTITAAIAQIMADVAHYLGAEAIKIVCLKLVTTVENGSLITAIKPQTTEPTSSLSGYPNISPTKT